MLGSYSEISGLDKAAPDPTIEADWAISAKNACELIARSATLVSFRNVFIDRIAPQPRTTQLDVVDLENSVWQMELLLYYISIFTDTP